MCERLEIYFDEGGDFGIGNDNPDLLIISVAVLTEPDKNRQNLLSLEEELKAAGYDGVIHAAPLVRNEGPFRALLPENRRNIFWALYNFARTPGMVVRACVLDKSKLENPQDMRSWAKREISLLLDSLTQEYEKNALHIYYDGGQKPLMEILYSYAETKLSSDNYHADFDHDKNRIFQVADLMTYVHRLNFKSQHGILLNSSDRRFFSKDALERIKGDLASY